MILLYPNKQILANVHIIEYTSAVFEAITIMTQKGAWVLVRHPPTCLLDSLF